MGGFCSVNMAVGGLYTLGGSFWEFGEPDWERTKYFIMFGVAEDHDSNPIKAGIAALKGRGAKFISVNPVKTGYSAVADEWVGIRPGTDGLFVLALVHELLRTDQIDLEWMVRATNAHWLVIRNPGGADDGLFARDELGKPLAWDKAAAAPADASTPGLNPAVVGEVMLPDGRKAVPVFHLMAERYLAPEYAPAAVADRCGVSAETIIRIAAEMADTAFNQAITLEQSWTDTAGRVHTKMVGRPVAVHAMRGISAHSNGSIPAGRCICCRCCWAPSIRPVHGATSRRIRSRSRRARRQWARARRRTRTCRAWRSAFRKGRSICCSTMTARRCASTRHSRGRRRFRRTG